MEKFEKTSATKYDLRTASGKYNKFKDSLSLRRNKNVGEKTDKDFIDREKAKANYKLLKAQNKKESITTKKI